MLFLLSAVFTCPHINIVNRGMPVLDSPDCNELLLFQDLNTGTMVPKVESVQQKNKLKQGLGY